MYEKVTASEALFWVIVALVFGFGMIAAMIGGLVRETFQDWREDRREKRLEETVPRSPREARAQQDATRILAGLYPDRYETETTNEQYFAAETRTLSDRWRAFVAEAAPRSPEIVAESVYREATYQFTPIRAELARSWPEWTDEERATPGRHRAEDPDGRPYPDRIRDALNVSTGSFEAVRGRELVNA